MYFRAPFRAQLHLELFPLNIPYVYSSVVPCWLLHIKGRPALQSGLRIFEFSGLVLRERVHSCHRFATVRTSSSGVVQSRAPSEIFPKVPRPPAVSLEPSSLVEAISRAPVSFKASLAASICSEVSHWTDNGVPVFHGTLIAFRLIFGYSHTHQGSNDAAYGSTDADACERGHNWPAAMSGPAPR